MLWKAANTLGVTLIGGHSEVTQGIQRPIVMGTMLGEVERDSLITTAGAQEGDSIVVTKGVAIEGTALLARDCAGELRRAGVEESVIVKSAEMLNTPGISVVHDAQTSVQLPVHSIHDITEGGLFTALHEVAAASGLGLAVEEDSVPVLPETECGVYRLGFTPNGTSGFRRNAGNTTPAIYTQPFALPGSGRYQRLGDRPDASGGGG